MTSPLLPSFRLEGKVTLASEASRIITGSILTADDGKSL